VAFVTRPIRSGLLLAQLQKPVEVLMLVIHDLLMVYVIQGVESLYCLFVI
jgi:hypothetical protein